MLSRSLLSRQQSSGPICINREADVIVFELDLPRVFDRERVQVEVSGDAMAAVVVELFAAVTGYQWRVTTNELEELCGSCYIEINQENGRRLCYREYSPMYFFDLRSETALLKVPERIIVGGKVSFR